jgi:hypothetical protein
MATHPPFDFVKRRKEPFLTLRRFGRFKAFAPVDTPTIRFKGVIGCVKRAYYPKGTSYPQSQGITAIAKRLGAIIKGPKGMVLGKLVDRQLDSAVKHIGRLACTVRQYLGMIASAAMSVPIRNKGKKVSGKRILKLGPKTHKRTIAVLRYLADRGWHPLACQVPVCCSSSRTGTMVDMICIDTKNNNKLICLENKSGFVASYLEGSTKMLYPFHDRNDSDHNRHQLQLMLTTMLMRHTFGMQHSEMHSAVLRVDDDNVEHIPLEPWVLAGESDLQRRFFNNKSSGPVLPVLPTPSKRVTTIKKKRNTTKKVKTIKKKRIVKKKTTKAKKKVTTTKKKKGGNCTRSSA